MINYLKKILLGILAIFLISSCATTYIWNPNNLPENQLAEIKLKAMGSDSSSGSGISFQESMTPMWQIFSIDGEKVEKGPWSLGNTLLLSTTDVHTLEIGIIKTAIFGKYTYYEPRIKIKLDFKFNPGSEYVFALEKKKPGVYVHTYAFTLRKPPSKALGFFLPDSVKALNQGDMLRSWEVIADNKNGSVTLK